MVWRTSKFCLAATGLDFARSRFRGRLFAFTVVTTSTSPPLTDNDCISRAPFADMGRFFFRFPERVKRSWCCFNVAICSPFVSMRATSWSSSRSRSPRNPSSSVSWICLSNSLCSLGIKNTEFLPLDPGRIILFWIQCYYRKKPKLN